MKKRRYSKKRSLGIGIGIGAGGITLTSLIIYYLVHKIYGSKEYYVKKIKGDGSCMFRAVADQLEGDEEKYQKYRNIGVDYLSNHLNADIEEIIRGLYKITPKEYLEDMKKSMWGDHIMIQMLSNALIRNILIVNQNGYVTYINPQSGGSKGVMILEYLDGNHYNSIRVR